MPDVMGLGIYDAVEMLEESGLQVEIEGSGSMVTSQFPYSGVEVIKNGIVVIKTES